MFNNGTLVDVVNNKHRHVTTVCTWLAYQDCRMDSLMQNQNKFHTTSSKVTLHCFCLDPWKQWIWCLQQTHVHDCMLTAHLSYITNPYSVAKTHSPSIALSTAERYSKGHPSSQWKHTIFGGLPHKNYWGNKDKIWQKWLRWEGKPTGKIW